MITFEVGSITHAGELLLMGVIAGVAFYLVDKYLLVPVEQKTGIVAAA